MPPRRHPDEKPVGMDYDEYQGGLRSISLFGVFVGVAALGALAFSVLAYTQTHHDRTQVKALQARVAHQLAVLRHRNAALGNKVNSTARRLKQKDAGIAPLAARALKSVFTIKTPDGWLGAGFAAWRQDGDTYFITANHVVSHTIENNYVDVKRKGGSWAGEVMVRDSQNDLALVRVVGVLVAGGGENLNFAVPIGRACVKLRVC